jgi:CheY-like chemotaxis protein
MNPMKILLVDDSKSARYALRLQLQRHGAAVQTADSAEAALETVKQDPPDAIFMDHTMPGMNGFEALEILKSDPRTTHIPVVMCTSNEEPEFVAQARRKGALGILSKAAASDKLSGLLERLDHAIAAPVPGIAEAPAAPVEPGAAAFSELSEARVRALVEPMLDALSQRLRSEWTAEMEETLRTRLQEESKRLQDRLSQVQSQQSQAAADRLVEERIPEALARHSAAANKEVEQWVREQIDKERQQIAGMVQDLIDASLDQLVEQPSFLRHVLEATEASAASSAEQVVMRQAQRIAETVSEERAGQVADSLLRSSHVQLRSMYVLAAGAAGIGIAAAALVYLLLR